MEEIDIKSELPWHRGFKTVMQSQGGQQLGSGPSSIAHPSDVLQGLNFRASTKRKRKPDFTDHEQTALLESIASHRETLADAAVSGGNQHPTPGRAEAAWAEVASAVNAVAPRTHGTKRSVTELKIKWKHLKSLARKKRAALVAARGNKTPSEAELLSARDRKILGLIGFRPPGGYDLRGGRSAPTLPPIAPRPPPDALTQLDSSPTDPFLTPPPTLFVSVPMSASPPPLPSTRPPDREVMSTGRLEMPTGRRRRPRRHRYDLVDVGNRQVEAMNNQTQVLSQILACLQSIATSLDHR